MLFSGGPPSRFGRGIEQAEDGEGDTGIRQRPRTSNFILVPRDPELGLRVARECDHQDRYQRKDPENQDERNSTRSTRSGETIEP